jgi:hypothetical protein
MYRERKSPDKVLKTISMLNRMLVPCTNWIFSLHVHKPLLKEWGGGGGIKKYVLL